MSSGNARVSAFGRTSVGALNLVPAEQTRRSRAEPVDAVGDQLEPATRKSFRDAMQQLAGGVCLVTFGRGSQRSGMTATSIVSLSADPPSLLFCIQRSSSAYVPLADSDAFAVNVLAADQREFAERFSGSESLRGVDRYHGDEWRELPSGVSGLSSAAAILDCEIEERLERATHAIIIGRVRHVRVGDGGGALLYWRATYDQLGWRRDEIDRAIGLSPRGAG